MLIYIIFGILITLKNNILILCTPTLVWYDVQWIRNRLLFSGHAFDITVHTDYNNITTDYKFRLLNIATCWFHRIMLLKP